jgi:hypothetical protein
MSNGLKIGLGIFLAIVVFLGGIIAFVFSAKFTAHEFETSVIAQSRSMENTWGQMEQQLKMSGFTVQNYGETFIKSLEANAKRYENDKGAMMKWVQEAAGVMSPDMHKKFSDSIEKAYAKKEARQLNKIAVSEQYERFLGNSIKGMVATTVWSYPTPEVKKIMKTIVSTTEAKSAIETGIEKEVKNPF